MMRLAVSVASLALVGCFNFSADLETCARINRCQFDDGGELDGGEAVDSGVLDGGGLDGGPLDGGGADAGAACSARATIDFGACGFHREYFLAPNGSDLASGLDEAHPRATTTGLVLGQGDRVHFAAGTYTTDAGLVLKGSGISTCPLVFEGAPDGGTFFVGKAVALIGASARLYRATIIATSGSALGVKGTDMVVASTVVVGQSYEYNLIAVSGCQQCAMLNSVIFVDGGSYNSLLETWETTNLVVRGNHFFTPSHYTQAVYGNASVVDASVEWNEFEGPGHVEVGGTNNLFARNLVHGSRSAVVVTFNGTVSQNTFSDLGLSSTAAAANNFSNNIVETALVGFVGDGGVGYNLFNAVPTPYAGRALASTDSLGPAKLGAGWSLGDGSAAIDAADPTLPVPPGGGGRADIGAIERGAVKQEDGRYCLPGVTPR